MEETVIILLQIIEHQVECDITNLFADWRKYFVLRNTTEAE